MSFLLRRFTGLCPLTSYRSSALGNLPRPDSPSNEHVDESMDSIVLDEDLASIARDVRAQVNRGNDVEKRGGPEIVTIKVHWQPHPLNVDGHANIWTIEMNRVLIFPIIFYTVLVTSSLQRDTFHALFEDIADAAGMLTGSLILTHDGSRVFASATPHSLKIWAEAQMGAFIPKAWMCFFML